MFGRKPNMNRIFLLFLSCALFLASTIIIIEIKDRQISVGLPVQIIFHAKPKFSKIKFLPTFMFPCGKFSFIVAVAGTCCSEKKQTILSNFRKSNAAKQFQDVLQLESKFFARILYPFFLFFFASLAAVLESRPKGTIGSSLCLFLWFSLKDN